MRFKLLFFLASVSTLYIAAQNGDNVLRYDPYMAEPLPKNAPQWMQRIVDAPSDVNFHEMQQLYQQWTANDVDARVKTLDNKQAVNFYRRWMSAYRRFVAPDGSIILPTMEEYRAKVDAMNARVSLMRKTKDREGATEQLWRNIGPNRTYKNENGTVKQKDSQVCVYRIAVSLSDSATLYCGTESGVVFKTTDHGESWQPCAPQHNFGGPIFSIAIDPTDKNTVYVGGGPWLWKSIDGGDSWKRCGNIEGRVNSIRINPDNVQYVTASTGGKEIKNQYNGFFISTDGGKNFTCTLSGLCFDHELQPGNPSRIYLLRRENDDWWAKPYISTDGGHSWTSTEFPVSSVICGRLAVSCAPGGENHLYAITTSDPYYYNTGLYGGKGTPSVLVSVDAGETWTDKTVFKGSRHGHNTFSPFLDETGGQGYFDMMIGASAKDPRHVLFGLCSLYRSTEEGATTYTDGGIGGYQRSDWMHCDIQDIAVHPCGDTWVCNDGGIKYSADFFETKGQDRYSGIYASDYQGLGIGWNEDVMAAGRWHNGDVVHAKTYGEGNSLHVGGVEMPTGYVMRSNPWKVFYSDAGTRIMPRTMDGEIKEDYRTWFFDKAPYEALRINGEIATDPRYALKIFFQDKTNYYEGYMSYDEGQSFQKVFDSDAENFFNYEFARSNPDYMYIAGTYNVWRSRDGGLSFEVCPAQPFPEHTWRMPFTRVTVDPNNENHVIMVCHDIAGAVAESFDGGDSWAPMNIGSAAAHKIHQVILVGDNHGSIYLTTYEGAHVFFKDNSMSDFIDYSSGLNPGARITKVVPFYKDAVLRMATDQGVWEAPLYHRDFRPVAQPMALNLGSGDISANPHMEVQFDSYSIVHQDENTRWQWSFSPEPFSVSDADARNPKVVFGRNGEYDVTLTVTTPAGSHSRTIKKMITVSGVPTEIDEKSAGKVGPQNVMLEQGEPLSLYTSGLCGDATITIHNPKGHLLHSATLSSKEAIEEVQLPILDKGVYIYSIKTATQKFFGQFIIK